MPLFLCLIDAYFAAMITRAAFMLRLLLRRHAADVTLIRHMPIFRLITLIYAYADVAADYAPRASSR